MPTYAWVTTDRNPNVVLGVVASPTPPPGPTGGEIIDVTNLAPQPGIGWTYDGTNFAKPPDLANHETLTGKAQAALNANATFLGLGAPTQAQTLAQVQLLTREVNALIRIVLNQLDTVANT